MKRIIALLTAGLIAMMAFSSCEINIGTSEAVSIDAYLTVYYAGGLPQASAQGRYDLSSSRLSENDIEDIFYQLSSTMNPGFTDAVLEIEFYDWLDNFQYMRTFDFWWESYDYVTGDGYYAWQERK